MSGPEDAYRLKAADMLTMAEQHEHFRDDFEELAKAYLHLGKHADRNVQTDQAVEPQDPVVHQRQQSQEPPRPQEQPQQQQQQQPQVIDKATN